MRQDTHFKTNYNQKMEKEGNKVNKNGDTKNATFNR